DDRGHGKTARPGPTDGEDTAAYLRVAIRPESRLWPDSGKTDAAPRNRVASVSNSGPEAAAFACRRQHSAPERRCDRRDRVPELQGAAQRAAGSFALQPAHRSEWLGQDEHDSGASAPAHAFAPSAQTAGTAG